MLLADSADLKLVIFFIFFQNRIWHFMQIVSKGDNLHKVSDPKSRKSEKKPFLNVVCWNILPSMTYFLRRKENQNGPVVQSVVSLTSSLRVISLTVLVDSIYNILIFFAEKMLLTFFQQKISAYLLITRSKFEVNFNESLTNDIVSFEQLGPEYCLPLF